MRYILIVWYLLLSSVDALHAYSEYSTARLSARGSRSPSPPPHRPPSTGLLGDVVAHSTSRPGASVHPSQQSHSAHQSQAQVQPSHPGQLQAHSAHMQAAHSAFASQMQAHHAYLSQLQGHPARLSQVQTHPAQLQAHPAHLTAAHLGQVQAQSAHLSQSTSSKSTSRRTASGPRYQPPKGGNLAHLVTGVRADMKPIAKPTRNKKSMATSTTVAAKADRVPWWKKEGGQPGHQGQRAPSDNPRPKREKWWKTAGGMPARQPGTAPNYEAQKNLRNRKKFQALLQNPPDLPEHPSGHQPHSHDRPPSPGAGSHAVSKRRLQRGLVPSAA